MENKIDVNLLLEQYDKKILELNRENIYLKATITKLQGELAEFKEIEQVVSNKNIDS